MTVPLVVLAVLSIFAGYFGIPHFIEPVLQGPTGHDGTTAHDGPLLLKLIAIAMGVGGIAAAWVAYVKSPGLPDRLAEKWRQAYDYSFHKWYVDELYDRTIVKPTVDLANGLWKRVDVAVIDAMVNGVGSAALLWAQGMRVVQSGQVQHYALAMALGAVTILGVYLLFMP